MSSETSPLTIEDLKKIIDETIPENEKIATVVRTLQETRKNPALFEKLKELYDKSKTFPERTLEWYLVHAYETHKQLPPPGANTAYHRR